MKKQLAQFAWYMRGGVTMSELYQMSITDQQYLTSVIEENVELSKKAQQIII